MRWSWLTAVAIVLPTLAYAEGIDIASGLADVIAAEDFCGLDYDQRAIEGFVRDNVKDYDLEFTNLLKGLIVIAEAAQEKMTESAKTAHCTHILRLAARFAFTGD